VEFLEKLEALTRGPEINLALYLDLLALHARWRPDYTRWFFLAHLCRLRARLY